MGRLQSPPPQIPSPRRACVGSQHPPGRGRVRGRSTPHRRVHFAGRLAGMAPRRHKAQRGVWCETTINHLMPPVLAPQKSKIDGSSFVNQARPTLSKAHPSAQNGKPPHIRVLSFPHGPSCDTPLQPRFQLPMVLSKRPTANLLSPSSACWVSPSSGERPGEGPREPSAPLPKPPLKQRFFDMEKRNA